MVGALWTWREASRMRKPIVAIKVGYTEAGRQGSRLAHRRVGRNR